ncbi:3-oxoacyl-[acyl-carrier-protein] reductase FabG [compost metagenome]
MTPKKVWLITGAGRGIGLEMTKAVLASGDKVVATVRKSAEILKEKLGHPENLHVILLDVTDEQQAIQSAIQTVERFGRIDVLLNNAGYGVLGALEETGADEVKKNFETNVFGLLNVTRAVLPYMRGQRSGHIINISSIGGLTGYTGFGIYCATKFAVEGITESLAQEVAPLGINVTAVAPGFFRTNFLDASSLFRADRVISDYVSTSGEMESFAAHYNNNQPGDPVKLASAIVKLANAEQPPVHLLLGNDALETYREKINRLEQDIKAWHDVTTSTDHDDVK